MTRPEEFDLRPPPKPERAAGGSVFPRAAAVCFVLAAVLSMAGSLYSAITPVSPEEFANDTAGLDAVTIAVLYVCSLISIWSQVFTLLGGIMAYQRTNWKLVVVCGFFSLLTLGFVLIESSVLGAIGLILVFASRREFIS